MLRGLFVVMVAVTLGGRANAAPTADKKPAEKGEAKGDTKGDAKKGAAKADLNGTWTWSMEGRDGAVRESKLTLKVEGEKLTGTISGRNGDTAISEGKTAKDGAVSFKVERDRNGTKMVASYVGKFDGTLIKGTQTSNFGGQDQSRPWEAKRGN